MSREYDISSHPRFLEQKQKRKKVIYRKTILFFVFFIVFIIGLSYFSGYHTVVINDIKIEGNNITNTDKLKSLVLENIEGRYLYLFKKSNIFIYPKNEIIKNIEKNFPRISDIDIKSDSLTSIHIKIKEREGAMLWCGESFQGEAYFIEEECFFINSDGYIFDKAPFFSGNIYFKFYTPLKNKDLPPLGNYSLDKEKINEIMIFVNGLEDLSFYPAFIDLSDKEMQKIFLKRDSLKLPQIFFKEENDKNEILDNLASSMKKDAFVHEVKSKYSILDYIDLRYKNKIIYKHYE